MYTFILALVVLAPMATPYVRHVEAITYCNDAPSCSDGTLSTDEIACQGHESCQNASLFSTSDTNCQASHSCISTTIEAGQGIDCNGRYSCYQSDLTARTFFPWSEMSAYDTIVNISYPDNHDDKLSLQIIGFAAFMHSNVTMSTASTFTIGAHLAASNSFFISGHQEMLLAFHGATTGINATIVCNQGHTCTINCYGGAATACDTMNFVSLGGEFNVRCALGAVESETCPEGQKRTDFTSQTVQIPDLVSETGIYRDLSQICSYDSNTTTICADSAQCAYDDKYQGNTVCCLGKHACLSMHINDTYSDELLQLECNGYRACYWLKMRITRPATGVDKNIFFSAKQGGYQSDIIANSDYHIRCHGVYACWEAAFENVGNVYCLGRWSCEDANATNVVNVYGYAMDTMSGARFTNIAGSFYCEGHSGCLEAHIMNVGGGVIGEGLTVLGKSVIGNAEFVAVFGQYALTSAQLTNVSRVYCDGGNCLKQCQMSRVSEIRVAGNNAMMNSLIISGEPDDNVLDIYVKGDTTTTWDVYCNETDTCRIDCQSNDSCSFLDIHCFGTCYINCGYQSGIACPPINNTGNAWIQLDWTATENPSEIPSIYPTLQPSDMTNAPSETPSIYPTVFPTSVPLPDLTSESGAEGSEGAATKDSDSSELSEKEVLFLVIACVFACLCVILSGMSSFFYKRVRQYKSMAMTQKYNSDRDNYNLGTGELEKVGSGMSDARLASSSVSRADELLVDPVGQNKAIHVKRMVSEGNDTELTDQVEDLYSNIEHDVDTPTGVMQTGDYGTHGEGDEQTQE